MKTYLCYFDGSCEPQNPNGAMGYGIYIKSDDSEYWDAKQIPPKVGNTNNIAEYLGLLLILNLMIKKENSHIKIYGDSLMVVNQMNGTFAIKEGGYVPYAKKAKELLNKVKEKNIVEINWIPREENEIADNLSKSFVEGKYPIIKSNSVEKPKPEPIKTYKIFLQVELPSNLFDKNPTVQEVRDKLIKFGESNLGHLVMESVSGENHSINIVEETENEIQDKEDVKPKVILYDTDVLWNTFKKILEKAIKNRDGFAELYTEIKFTDKQLEHINNLGMVDLYYDETSLKYVLTLKW